MPLQVTSPGPVFDYTSTGSCGRATSPLFDYDGAADYLHVSRRTVHRMVAAGELPYVAIGNRRLFHVDDLDAKIESGRVSVRS